MCLAEIPKLINYAYIPSIFLSIFFGSYIYIQKKDGKLNRLLLYISLIFSIWITLAYVSWFGWSLSQYMIIQKFLTMGIVIMPLFVYFACYLGSREVSKLKNVLIWIPILPLIFVNFSKYNYLLYTLDEKCLVIEKLFYPYLYLLVAVYLLWFTLILVKKYRSRDIDATVGKQIKTVAYAGAILILWTIILTKAEVFFGEDVLVFIPFGMVIFIGMLAYATTKHQLFDIKIISAQILTYMIWILIGSEYFFVESTVNIILVTLTLLLSIVFGIFLIKSVKNEVKRKEELQMMSDKLAQANDKLTKLDNAKSEFISIASHQLRTPLTAIKGFISMLLEGSYGKMEAKQEDILNKVYTSNERLIHLVEDLLNISRMESGRMEFKFEKTKIESICREVIDTFLIRAKEHNLKLEYAPPKIAMPELMIDGIKIREVVSNLVDNALKYTPKGSVSLRLELTDNQQLTTDSKQVVRVIISDTGIGVPKTELPYLFAKFSRGKDVSRLNTGGTGLGLYVGKGMVEANGGRIWAESDGEGKGSRFIIELPVEQNKKILERWG